MTHSRRHFLSASAALAGSTLAFSAQAQSSSNVRIVAGFAAGGSADFIARQLASHIKLEGVGTVIVDNRPGAGGRIGVESVKSAPADGRTLLLTPGSILAIYPHVYSKLSYDPVRDLQPITVMASVPYGLSVGPMVPASVKTMKDFAKWCKENPKDASYGSPGGGTTPHFVGAMFAREIGATYQHVPYRGGALALQEVMAGQIASAVTVISEAVPLAQTGKVRTLAVSSTQRLVQLPDVPTFEEAGFGQLTSQEWFGLFAPAGTPMALVQAYNQAARKAFATQAVQKAMAEMAFIVEGNTPQEFAALLQRDLKRWEPVVKSTGFKADE